MKVGIALGDTDSALAEPCKILRYSDTRILSAKIKRIVKDEGVEKIVVGVSEGKMAGETKEFGKLLEQELKIPVVFQDETLTTADAQALSIEAGINRKKRKGMEDAFSAALILQKYFDSVSLLNHES
ncbi:Holliday junction resolvase RuvX [Candidatus Woesebacteria bacterium]|nr:Holliday junction resolvase RuvX [Candidatus Woesebacteria bacterium]